jgi:glycosyltransferase involved in cell wall biosynthesis
MPSRAPKRTLHAAIGQIAVPRGVSYTVHELFDHLGSTPLHRRLWCITTQAGFDRDYHQPVLSRLAWRMLCKLRVSDARQAAWVYRNAAAAVRPGDLMYVWPPYDLGLIRRAKDQGGVVIAERINCMARTCKDVLEPAFARLGRSLPDGWCVPKDMDAEDVQMRMCDFVTAPNVFVVRSLLDAGLPVSRILETSYGWSPRRLRSAIGIERPSRPAVFLFVGMGIVRKGLDLLLDYWERAGVQGELHIAGHIDDDIRSRCARQLARSDVKQLGYITDMASVYASSDVFVFPSHEEGGPQVTYEAAGCGLPCLVSPMGAGRLVRDGVEGRIVDPFDSDAWVDTLRRLSADAPARRQLGAAAARRAAEFTWDRVGARFAELLHSRACAEASLPTAASQPTQP